MDELKRHLDNFDRSPTVQALLLLAAIYLRYVVAKALALRKKRPPKKRQKGA